MKSPTPRRSSIEPPLRASEHVDWSAVGAASDVLVPLPSNRIEERLSMRFRKIPAGTFLMGSRGYSAREEPRHRVEIPHDFWLGKYVVTQEEWKWCVSKLGLNIHIWTGNEPRSLKKFEPQPSRFKGGRRPVEQVSWDDCRAWCTAWRTWLREKFPNEWFSSVDVDLPSEAHWEYACRAGGNTEFWNGDGEAALLTVGWFAENAGGQTHDVDEPVVSGVAEHHPAGLIGMHGNVLEWCSDAFLEGTYRRRKDGYSTDFHKSIADDETGASVARATRGGSWRSAAGRCRSASRERDWPGDRIGDHGFRVCLLS